MVREIYLFSAAIEKARFNTTLEYFPEDGGYFLGMYKNECLSSLRKAGFKITETIHTDDAEIYPAYFDDLGKYHNSVWRKLYMFRVELKN